MLYDQWLVRAHKWDLTVLSQKSRYALLAQLVEQLTLNQRAQGSSPWKCTTKRQDVCPAFFVALPPLRGRLPRSRCWRSGSARRASQAKKYATGILFLTPSSRSAPQRGKRFWMLAFLLLHFPPTGAASPFALRAPVQLAGPLRLKNMPPAYCS